MHACKLVPSAECCDCMQCEDLCDCPVCGKIVELIPDAKGRTVCPRCNARLIEKAILGWQPETDSDIEDMVMEMTEDAAEDMSKAGASLFQGMFGAMMMTGRG